MENTLEKFLRFIDSALGLDNMSALFWLIYVMAFFLALLCFSEFLKWRNISFYGGKKRTTYLVLLLLGFSSCFSLSAFVISYLSGHFYNFYVVVGLIAQMACLFIASAIWHGLIENGRLELAKRFMVHFNAIIIIFLVAGKWLIRGVDAEETSADTLNIYYNGGFRYSMHAGWYDLAPIDSIIKVMLLRIRLVHSYTKV